MLFQTLASVVLLATAATAASGDVEQQPHRLAFMPLPGQSLMRREDVGYKPDQRQCKAGSSCAEACGPAYSQCPGGNPGAAHCYNPSAGESCCTDNSGNACEAGFYCARDSTHTWCCPKDMDVAACAAAHSIAGLVAATPKPAPTSSTTSTSTTSTTSTSSTTSKAPTTTPVASTTSVPNMTTTTTTTATKNTTAPAGMATAWNGSNSTILNHAPTQPSGTGSSVTSLPLPTSLKVSAANASGVSALLLVVAFFVSLL